MRSTFQILVVFLLLIVVISCEKEDVRQKSYWIYQAGFTPTAGTATITDLGNDNIKIEIKLRPFIPGKYPAHLHFGDINEVGELALQLSDLDGETGQSATIIQKQRLSNGDFLTYDHLMEMNGSIKIHQNSAQFKHILVAYGNVGVNDEYAASGVSNCVGH